MSAAELSEQLLQAVYDPKVHDLDFLDLSDINGTDNGHYVLSETETQILELNDRLIEIQLESILLQNSANDPPVLLGQGLEEQISVAENEALEAKAAYSLKHRVIESVLTADPILKAVHSGTQASPVERALLPLIEQRDLLNMVHTQLSTDLSNLMASLSVLETNNIQLSEKNRALSQTLTDLAEISKTNTIDEIKDTRTRSQLELLKEENRVRKSRWRLMKGVVSTVVVGSGVDWARDDELRELVLDNEE